MSISTIQKNRVANLHLFFVDLLKWYLLCKYLHQISNYYFKTFQLISRIHCQREITS